MVKKILCVGIGGYANVYLESLLNCEKVNFEIVGLVDISKRFCNFTKELADIPFYYSIDEFYKEHKADLCIITTPIHFHTRQILCALKNGSNVICEKPLSGCSQDAEIILAEARKVNKFVMIGYQWSYSETINTLKKDIQSGIYGKPEFLKTIVLWPRNKEYFTRGSGWAGKLIADDGTVINDSIANNAAAHYLHNMLYITGTEYGKSSEVVSVEADLLRTNNIENFDTSVIRFALDNGAIGLFIASHSTLQTLEPCFEYRFSNGVITYNDSQKMVIGKTKDGVVKKYGNPFNNINRKIYEAIEACDKEKYIPPCGVEAAAAHVRCVEKIQSHKIANVNPEYVKENGNLLYVDGLDILLLECYQEEKMLSQTPYYKKLVKNDSAR